MVFDANTESKTEHTIWKSIKNWAENWCQIVCGILFDLIYSMTSSAEPFAPGENLSEWPHIATALRFCTNFLVCFEDIFKAYLLIWKDFLESYSK